MLSFVLELKILLKCLSDIINESLTKYFNSIFLRLILRSLCNALLYPTEGGSCNLPTHGILHSQDTQRDACAVCILMLAYFF